MSREQDKITESNVDLDCYAFRSADYARIRQYPGRGGLSLISANYALLAALPGARVARIYLLQMPGAFTQIVCTVIRSTCVTPSDFWIGKEVPLQPRLWRVTAGTTMRGAALRNTTRICRIGTILSPAGWRSRNQPSGAEAPSAGHVV